MPLPPTFDARLLRARPVSPSVRELVFERADGLPFDFEPGQWVSLILPNDPRQPDDDAEGDLRRAYSIASAPDGSPRFELAITLVPGGPGSSLLHTTRPGACIKAVGPQGFFTRVVEPGAGSPSLFIATGTGVTPLRSMLRAAIATGQKAPLWLLFGLRHEEDILYREELETLAATHPFVKVFFTLSQPPPSWAGRSGYVQSHLPELWNLLAEAAKSGGFGEAHAYVCGLERMVGAVRTVLRRELGLPRQRVHSERYD